MKLKVIKEKIIINKLPYIGDITKRLVKQLKKAVQDKGLKTILGVCQKKKENF